MREKLYLGSAGGSEFWIAIDESNEGNIVLEQDTERDGLYDRKRINIRPEVLMNAIDIARVLTGDTESDEDGFNEVVARLHYLSISEERPVWQIIDMLLDEHDSRSDTDG